MSQKICPGSMGKRGKEAKMADISLEENTLMDLNDHKTTILRRGQTKGRWGSSRCLVCSFRSNEEIIADMTTVFWVHLLPPSSSTPAQYTRPLDWSAEVSRCPGKKARGVIGRVMDDVN